jgi:hypothetical protein
MNNVAVVAVMNLRKVNMVCANFTMSLLKDNVYLKLK